MTSAEKRLAAEDFKSDDQVSAVMTSKSLTAEADISKLKFGVFFFGALFGGYWGFAFCPAPPF